jgi:hypothetical protein
MIAQITTPIGISGCTLSLVPAIVANTEIQNIRDMVMKNIFMGNKI